MDFINDFLLSWEFISLTLSSLLAFGVAWYQLTQTRAHSSALSDQTIVNVGWAAACIIITIVYVANTLSLGSSKITAHEQSLKAKAMEIKLESIEQSVQFISKEMKKL